MPSGVSNRLTMSSTTRMALPATSADAAARFDGVEITAMLVLAPPPEMSRSWFSSLVELTGEAGPLTDFRFACQCSKLPPATTGSMHRIAYRARPRHEPRGAKISLILLVFRREAPERASALVHSGDRAVGPPAPVLPGP